MLDRPNLLDLELRILCLHPLAHAAYLPRKVTDEAGLVAGSFDEIRAFLTANAQQIGRGGRSLTISTRAYSTLPYVGGWHVVAPERHQVHYVSLNGYRPSFDGRFKWLDQYMVFSGHHVVGSAGHYFTDYYDGLFAELWRMSVPMPEYEYQLPVAAEQDAIPGTSPVSDGD